MAILKWATEYAELTKTITGVDTNVLNSVYGRLGDVLMLASLPNSAAGEDRRAKLMASAKFMPKFLEGGQYALAGSVMQREIVKIA